MEHVSKSSIHVISHPEIDIMREICLKTGDFSTRDILVAPQCKNLVVALQEYFKIKFGAFLIINSILNEVLMLKFDHGAICESINPHNVLQNPSKP